MAWLDDTLALVNTITKGNGTDPEVKKAVTDLQTRVSADEDTLAKSNATIGDQQTVINALVAQLANAPATTPVPNPTAV